MKFDINLCKYKYRLLKIPKLNDVFMPLMNEIINYKDGLLSFTMTTDEVSLIITEDIYQDVFSKLPVYTTDTYYAATVDTVNPGLNEHGILSELTKIFAENQIPILCFSTYNYNYVLYLEKWHENVLKLSDNVNIELYHD